MFQRSENEPTLYIKKKENDSLIFGIYVDDIIYMGSSQFVIDEFKLSIILEFDVRYWGMLHYFVVLKFIKVITLFLLLKRNSCSICLKSLIY